MVQSNHAWQDYMDKSSDAIQPVQDDTDNTSDASQPVDTDGISKVLGRKAVLGWVISALLVILSAGGFVLFTESPCMSSDWTGCQEAQKSMSAWQQMMSGVENTSLAGLVVYSFTFPCICLTFLYALRITLALCSPLKQAILAAAFALVSLGLGTTGLLIWGDIWNGENSGIITVNGWGIFALSLCLSATLILIAFRKLVSRLCLFIPSWAISLSFIFVYIPLCVGVCMLLPEGEWKMLKGALHNANLKPGEGISFGPESFRLSIYTDVGIFYATIFLTCLAMAVAKEFRKSRLVLKKALRLGSFRTTIGSSLAVLVFVTLCLFWSLHYGIRHKANESKCSNIDVCNGVAQGAYVTGNLANLQIALLTLPIGRTNVFGKIMGVTWEASIKWHRFIGYLFLLFSTVHAALYFVLWYLRSDFTGNPEYMKVSITNPIIFLVHIVMLFVFGVLTLPFFRRQFYEWFFVSHHFYTVLYVTVLWHAGRLWYLLLPALGLWVIDQAIRLYRCTKVKGESKITVYGDQFVRLDVAGLQGETNEFTTGQFAYINVPSISTTQWHPMTIGSSPAEHGVTFYIKSLGSWSETLRQMRDTSPLVQMDFGYGTPPVWNDFQNISFVCGGIGITTCMSFARSLVSTPGLFSNIRRVQIILITRDEALVRMVQYTLKRLINGNPDIVSSVEIYMTGKAFSEPEDELDENILIGKAPSQTGDKLEGYNHTRKTSHGFGSNSIGDEINEPDQSRWSVNKGRPNLEKIILGDLVVACGSQQLIADARNVADNLGAVFHKERFLF